LPTLSPSGSNTPQPTRRATNTRVALIENPAFKSGKSWQYFSH